MMIIKDDENKFVVPLENNKINILISNEHSYKIIDYIQIYFGNKKKNTCSIYDDDNNIIKPNEVDFIYVPYKKLNYNNFTFKDKTDFNVFTEETIRNNPEYFKTLESVRRSISEFNSDAGFTKLKKIIGLGINKEINIELSNFSISSILSMLEITTDLSETEEYIAIYNVLLFLSRKTSCIFVYLDIPYNKILEKWIGLIEQNVIFIINGSSFMDYYPKSGTILKLNRTNIVQKETIDHSLFEVLIYLNNPFIRNNIKLQTEKNIQIYNNFNDDDVTYLLNSLPIDSHLVL